MFTEITVQRLSAGTVYKLTAVGLACSLLPLCIVFGVFAAFGAQTIAWNGRHLVGLSGLAMSPVVGVLLTGIGTLLLGSACAFGLWLYSFLRPISILVQDADAPAAVRAAA